MSGSSRKDDVENKIAPLFGSPMRKHFLFDADFVNLNHGSFGTYPSQIRTALRNYQDLAEARPDPFLRYDYPKMLDYSRSLMADYLNAPQDEIVFVPNATTGINTVLRNLRFEENEKILYCSTIYGACEKTVSYVCETTKAQSIRVEVEYPLSDDALVESFRDGLRHGKQDGGKVKVAIFDAIVSLPGMLAPFERLTDICREEGVLSLIDGAHAIGHVSLDLGKLQPDFFIGNCHKWIFAPRGCAVLYVPLKHQSSMRSSVPTSHGFVPLSVDGNTINNPLPSSNKSEFVNQFEFVGALDNSPYLCIAECFKFIDSVCGGKERYAAYCREIVLEGGSVVAATLGTEVMKNEGNTFQKCFFSNVRLPLTLGNGPGSIKEHDRNRVTQWLTSTTVTEYNTFMAFIFHGGAWWVRLSGQVYLERRDFEWAGKILSEVCRRAQGGEYLNM